MKKIAKILSISILVVQRSLAGLLPLVVVASAAAFILSGCNRASSIDDGYLGGIYLSSSTSGIRLSKTSLSAGENTEVTLSVKDQNGALFYVPNSRPTVAFRAAGGTSTGTFGPVTDHQDGTYTTKFTGAGAGTPTQISATLNGTTFGPSEPVQVMAGTTVGSIAWLSAPQLTYVASTSSPMTTLTAKLLDSDGNLMSANNASTVTISLSQGTGTLGGTLTKTAAGGVITFNDLVYTKAESIQITATENTSSRTIASGLIVVGPNTPSSITSTIAVGGSNISSDGVTPVSVTMTLKDGYGNVVPGVATHFSATGSSNTLTQPLSVTDALGQASGSMSSSVSETKTLSISLPTGLTSDTTTVTFAATAVVAATSSITGTGPVIANAVATSTVTITLRDTNSNPVGGVTPSFGASGSGNVYGACSATNASGVSTCTMTSTKAETKTLSITGPIAKSGGTVVFNPGIAQSLSVAGIASGVTAGAANSVTVTALDAYGNQATGYTGTVAFTTTSTSKTLPANYTFSSGSGLDNGAHTFAAGVALKTAGVQSVTATDTVTSSIAGVESAITVSAASASSTTSTIQVASSTIVADGNTSVTVTITLLDPYSNPVSGSAATFASTGTGNTLTQPSGSTNASGVITGSIKTTVAETKTLSIASPSGLTTDTVALTAAYPTLSIAAASANEGSNLTFTVTLSSASTQSVTVHYASSNGTAAAGTNYTATSGTVTIAAGSTTATITVPTTDDTVYNAALTMSMTLSTPTNSTIATAVGTGTINNTDAQPSIAINDVVANEGAAATFTVSLSNASYQSITVAYATSNGTAVAGTNYTAKSGTLTIPAGSTSGTVSVTTVDDGVYAATGLTFNLNLSSPTNATISDNLGIGTINNIDAAPTVQFTASTQSGNQSPSTQTVTVTAQLSAAENSNTAVNIPLTLSGTATSGTDYSISPTSITIAGGATTGTTTLTITNSGTPGADKTAILTMGTPTNAGLGSTTAQTVTIVNNNYPSVNFSVATQDVAINQGTATVTVTLSTAPTKTVTVPITISGSSTAVANTDYTLTAPTLTFTSGVTSQNFTYTILDQALPATANATLILGLGSITNGAVGATSTQTSTIRSPSLDLNFTAMYNPATQMSQVPYNQITFTRASTATYMDCDGVMKTAAVNVPRIDCNPTTGQPNGLFIEEARTNSAVYSADASNSTHFNFNVSTASNQKTAPDGTKSAASLADNDGSQTAYIDQGNATTTDSTTWTYSVYILKDAITTRYPALSLGFKAGTTNLYYNVFVNTQTGAVWPNGPATVSTVGSVDAGIYWRIWVTGTNNATGNTAVDTVFYPAAGTVVNGGFSAAATGTAYVWGAQLEQGAFPTSYIPTNTASATRSPDNVDLSSSMSSWLNPALGTLAIDGQTEYAPTVAQNYGFWFEGAKDANNRLGLFINLGSLNPFWQVTAAGAGTSPQMGSLSSSTNNRYAMIYNANDVIAAYGGTLSSAVTTATVPTGLTSFALGQYSTQYMNGWVRRFTSYKQRLPNSGLQYLSTPANSFRTFTPTVNLTLTSQTVIEPQGTVYVTAALSEPVTATVTVPYTIGGTAISGTNYSGLASGNFTFTAGQSRSPKSFTLIDDGTSTNPTITVTLGSGTGYSLGTNTAQTITIQRPSLDLNFAAMYNPATQISTAPYNAITFTRASVASYVDATGLIAYAANNVPRVDYNPTTHQPNGLLIEESRTNYALQSQNFNTTWGKTNTVSPFTQSYVGPDGSLTAAKAVESSDSGTNTLHYWNQSTATGISAAQNWTFTVFAKAGERSQILLVIYGTGNSNNVSGTFTLSGVGTSIAGNGGNGTGSTTSITAIGNGWYRCVVSGQPNTSGTGVTPQIMLANSGSSSYPGDGTSGLYIWGAQLEQGAFPTSYIPTTTAAVTRAADTAVASTGSWFSSVTGTLYSQFEMYSPNNNQGFVADFGDGTGSNRMSLYVGVGGSAAMHNDVFASSTSQAALDTPNASVSANINYQDVFAYQANNFAASFSGGSPLNSSTGTVPTVNQFVIGRYSGGSASYTDGGISRLTYYPVRLSNQQLQILSNPGIAGPRSTTPSVTLRTAAQSVYQTEGQAFFVAALSQPATGSITVPYTISGTATSGTDYSGLTSSGILTFTAGQSIAFAQFTVLSTSSNNKTVIITLGTPTGATIGTNAAETIYLTNSSSGFTLTSSTVSNNGSTVTFLGTCAPGMTVNISGNQTTSFTCPPSGSFTWTSGTVSSDGSYTYTFTPNDGTTSGTAVAGTYNRDTAAPSAVATFLDGNSTSSLTISPVMTWSASTDSGSGASGVAYYLLALGTTAGGVDVMPYTNVGNTALYQFTGLSLTNGAMYYGSIKAVDNAGNISAVTQGDGFAVVTDTPTLGLNFTNSTTIANGTALTSTNTSYPAAVQFSNASGSSIAAPMYYNSTGVLTAARENMIRNNSMQGAATGTPGTLPTNWVLGGSTGGLNQSVIAVGSDSGVSYFDINISGTATSSGNAFLSSETNSQVPAASSQIWTHSMFLKNTAGTLPNMNLAVREYNSGGSLLQLDGGSTLTVGTSTLLNQRYNASFTIGNASTSFIRPTLEISIQSGTVYNFTLRVGMPQLELGSTPSSYIYTTSAPAYGPRFDYNPANLSLNGLLIEESRTNSVTSSGAIGSGSWSASTYGTAPTIALNSSIAPDGSNTATTLTDGDSSGFSGLKQGLSASSGQTWTSSAYIKKTGTAPTCFPSVQVVFSGSATTFCSVFVNTQTGAVLDSGNAASLNIGSQDVGSYWRVWCTLAAPTGVTAVASYLYPANGNASGGVSASATCSNTFWGAQLEQGAMPTSYIPTTTAAMTRSADNAQVPASSAIWLGSGQGSLTTSAMSGSLYDTNTVGIFQGASSLELNGSNRIQAVRMFGSSSSDGKALAQFVNAGTTVAGATGTNGTWPILTSYSQALAWQSGSSATAGAGTILGTSASTFTMFSPTNLYVGNGSGNSYFNGWIQSINYYNTRLSNSAIQELTHP